MEKVTIESTLDLIEEFAKSSVILKKVNKAINKSIKARTISFNNDYSRLMEDDKIAAEIVNQESLRKLIGSLHDRLFLAIKQLPVEEKNQVYEEVCSYVSDYENRLATVTLAINKCCEEIKKLDKGNSDIRDELVRKINSLSTVKEELKYYCESYIALKHYIGGLTNAHRNNKRKK